MRFSEKHGYRSVRDVIQIESIDEPLRNGLWSLLLVHCWSHVRESVSGFSGYYLNDSVNSGICNLCTELWLSYFKEPLDQLDNDWAVVLSELRERFF